MLGLTGNFCCPVPVAWQRSCGPGRACGRAGALQVVSVAVGDQFLEPGPESQDDKKRDARAAPGRRTFQYNVPWGGELVRLDDGGLPRRARRARLPAEGPFG